MFGIVAEYLNPSRATTLEAERNLFFRSKNSLSNWAAWVGFYNSNARGLASAKHGWIYHSALGKLRSSGEEWQMGVSTAICGGLLFQTVNTRIEQNKLDIQSWARINGLVLLHPNLSFIPKKIRLFADQECDELHSRLVAASAQRKYLIYY